MPTTHIGIAEYAPIPMFGSFFVYIYMEYGNAEINGKNIVIGGDAKNNQ
jgi:hypothetical protein